VLTVDSKLIQDYINYVKVIQGKSKGTVKEYKYDLKMFMKFLKLQNKIENAKSEDDMLKQVTLNDIYDFLAYLEREKSYSASTRARKIASLKSFYKYLFKMRIISNNPTLELENPKIPKRLPVYLNFNQSQQLLNTVYNIRDYAILTLFLNCGLRLSELVNINIDDIKEDTLTVIGKGNKERIIYLNESSKKAIENYLKIRPEVNTKALFISNRGKRISNRTVQTMIKKYCAKAGIKNCSVHKLRHTAATLMYLNGVDIRLLQEILGHCNISTTQIYTHVDKQKLKDAINKNPLNLQTNKEEEEV
jgi:site-specific recombinase XerD